MKFLVTGGTGFLGWRVVRNLIQRKIPVVAADLHPDPDVLKYLHDAQAIAFDVSSPDELEALFRKHPDITHCIHLAYLMSAEVEENPVLGIRVNQQGMVNCFEAAVHHRLQRLIFTSSETVYGSSQSPYGDRPVTEDDYCGPQHHAFTYGVMKLLNEFMAQKYVQRHGISILATRPPVIFGHGRKRGSVLWAEAFASQPALGRTTKLPFPSTNRDTWIYVDDCAEQLVRLALLPRPMHFVYNNGGECVTAAGLASMVKHWLPDADITFDEDGSPTPLIDWQCGRRIESETGFTPRPLLEGVRAHINEARVAAGLDLV